FVDLDDALVRLQLELLAALLVDMRRAQHRPALHARGQRDRSAHPRTRLLRRPNDVRGSLVDHRVIERLESDPDLPSHGSSSLTRRRAAGSKTNPCGGTARCDSSLLRLLQDLRDDAGADGAAALADR